MPTLTWSILLLAGVLAGALAGWTAAALFWSAPPPVRSVRRVTSTGPLGRLHAFGTSGEAATLLDLARDEVIAWRERTIARSSDGAAVARRRARHLLGQVRRLGRRERRGRSNWWPVAAFVPTGAAASALRQDVDLLLAEIDALPRDRGSSG